MYVDEHYLQAVSFNGATAMKPWKSVVGDQPGDGLLGFNGATAMKPWKRTMVCATGAYLIGASMGPRR